MAMETCYAEISRQLPKESVTKLKAVAYGEWEMGEGDG